MASIDWPDTLPSPLNGTLQEGAGESYVSDPAQIGAARRRRRYTRALQTFAFQMTMTAAQAAILRTFVQTTTEGGVLEFNWTHPVTETAYEVRFATLPAIQQQTLGAWRASVEIEEI